MCGVSFIKFKNNLYTAEVRTDCGIIQKAEKIDLILFFMTIKMSQGGDEKGEYLPPIAILPNKLLPILFQQRSHLPYRSFNFR